MDNTPTRLHPLLAVAAVSVTAASLAAIGVLTGLLPGSGAPKTPTVEEPAAVVAQAATPAPAIAVPAAEPPPPPAPVEKTPDPMPAKKPAVRYAKPAAKPASHRVASSSAMPPPPPTVQNAPSSMPSSTVPPDYRPATASIPPAPPAPPTCRECGTVESVREVAIQQAQSPGIGAVAGGILGGVLGHQVGSGRGNDAATVLGAIGGAFAGHQIEKSQRKTVRYEIAVRMDDGTMQTLSAESAPAWRGGERVKVVNGVVMPMI